MLGTKAINIRETFLRYFFKLVCHFLLRNYFRNQNKTLTLKHVQSEKGNEANRKKYDIPTKATLQ
jgi:hypothetical protein